MSPPLPSPFSTSVAALPKLLLLPLPLPEEETVLPRR